MCPNKINSAANNPRALPGWKRKVQASLVKGSESSRCNLDLDRYEECTPPLHFDSMIESEHINTPSIKSGFIEDENIPVKNLP